MISSWRFFTILLSSFLLSALTCGIFGTYLVELTGAAPHKIIGRLGLLLALIGCWPWVRAQGLANRRDLGFAPPIGAFARTIGFGFAVGILMLTILAGALLWLDVRLINPELPVDPYRLPRGFAAGAVSGLLVGLIEESLFRGALFSAVRRQTGFLTSAIAPSLLFAALHFFKPQPLPTQASIDLTGCFLSLTQAVPNLFQAQHADSFLALALCGFLLALIREKTGHIGWCIGVHAGWIVVIRLLTSYTQANPNASFGWLIGSYDGVIGWLAVTWLALVTPIYWVLGRIRTRAKKGAKP